MLTDDKKKVLFHFNEGRNLYKLMKFKEALQRFQAALKIDPEDGPSQTYVARCKEYIEDPPPADWDGVYVMKTK